MKGKLTKMVLVLWLVNKILCLKKLRKRSVWEIELVLWNMSELKLECLMEIGN